MTLWSVEVSHPTTRFPCGMGARGGGASEESGSVAVGEVVLGRSMVAMACRSPPTFHLDGV